MGSSCLYTCRKLDKSSQPHPSPFIFHACSRTCRAPPPGKMLYLSHFRAWRALARATRDPKVLALFTACTTATCYMIGDTMQSITTSLSDASRPEVRRTDWQADAHALRSRRALQVILARANGEQSDEQFEDACRDMPALKGAQWHPGATNKQQQQQPQQRKTE